MADRTFFDRVWPSLVALVGTVAVVVALLVVFGDKLDDSGGDDAAAGEAVDDGAAPTDAPPTEGSETPDADAGETEPTPDPGVVTADPEDREPIGVLNATDIDGLDLEAQERFEAGGWEVPATATYDGTVDVTTVYYPEGMDGSAEALMNQFPEVVQMEPTIEGLNDTRLVVILGEEYPAAIGLDE